MVKMKNKKEILENEKKCKNLYSGFRWVSFFTKVRFATGSFVQLEKFVPKKGKILDLGCGYGIFSNYLALCSSQRKITGVDTDKGKIMHANRGIKNVSLSVGNATKMKLKNFDCILLHDVLHHLNSYEEQKELLKDCIKMLKTSGILLIVEVDEKPLWKWILCRFTDFVLYKGDSVYYLYRKDMLSLLKKHFVSKNIELKKFYGNPYPKTGYICKKN